MSTTATATHTLDTPSLLTPTASTIRIFRRAGLSMRWSAAEPTTNATTSRASRDDIRLRWILERGPLR